MTDILMTLFFAFIMACLAAPIVLAIRVGIRQRREQRELPPPTGAPSAR